MAVPSLVAAHKPDISIDQYSLSTLLSTVPVASLTAVHLYWASLLSAAVWSPRACRGGRHKGQVSYQCHQAGARRLHCSAREIPAGELK